MHRKLGLACTLALAALLALVAPVSAGGWAVVTLDELPAEVRAGQTVTLGFMVRQHGQTPIDVHTFEGRYPVLSATNLETRETISFEARKEGPEGHYVVDVTFPAAGGWAWRIAPEPFGPTDLGTLTVLPAVPAPAAPAPAAVPALTPALAAALQIAGAVLLAAALVTALLGLRNGRRPATQPSPKLR
ncbi:MAG TPA: hypothetical protein VNL77_23400 [Roseiflexaceae bacterium]|nr:hypothetical protein [Roseiflexaceae bacterium]